MVGEAIETYGRMPGPQDRSMLGMHKKQQDAVLCRQHAMNKVRRSGHVSAELGSAVARSCGNLICHDKDLVLVQM